MGIYIDPQGKSKEQWLVEKAFEIDIKSPGWPPQRDQVILCLVQNPTFSALGVCFNMREKEAFEYPDGRPRKWYWAQKEDVCSGEVGLNDFEKHAVETGILL